jgi:spore coat polysaccharide biosynthesis protein SpsF
MIIFQIERIRQSRLIDEVFVLTSTDATDDELVKVLKLYDVKFFRGDLFDVNLRFFQFLESHKECDVFVRLTGDCPLSCSDIIDLCVSSTRREGLDYLSNTLLPTFPDGLDVEVVRRRPFLNLDRNTLSDYQKEHVTPAIYQNPERFKLGNLSRKSNLSQIRFTVDNPNDYETISNFVATHPKVSEFSTFSTLSSELALGLEKLITTKRRDAISQGPWIDYSFHDEI